MNLYAHSAKDCYPSQSYEDHIRGVKELGESYLAQMLRYAKVDQEALAVSARLAWLLHDLGKLDKNNQDILSGRVKANRLAVPHEDAGVAGLLLDPDKPHIHAAAAVASHHAGLGNLLDELNREERAFRHAAIHERTDRDLMSFLRLHEQAVGAPQDAAPLACRGAGGVFNRMLLSLLADADHTDTATHYGKYPANAEMVPLLAEQRLAKLDEVVRGITLGANDDKQRFELRQAMYASCRDARVGASIASCDSPVGTGKTLAVMAHLLMQARQRGLRRTFVVLPFTNIIQQSVDVYRKALVLPGEDPEEVVAELHHRADYQSRDARHLTALWRAPIIVTTAVAFFETLAARRPSALRRLHELPGSAIFVDESHAALPVKLLPMTWQWMQTFADEWSCYWVLASGSLTRFWSIPEIAGTADVRPVPEIVDDSLRAQLTQYEDQRISYRYEPRPMDTETLAAWVLSFPGPRLVIMNTVQSAAMLADHIAQGGRETVEHLSTALTAEDRERTLQRIKARLKDPDDVDWTLVATSCVEAGVNLSFRNGFREVASLLSLLQAAGRVDREGRLKASAMWSFLTAEDGKLIPNPSLKESAQVLKNYLDAGTDITPRLSTEAIVRELRLYGQLHRFPDLPRAEEDGAFRTVEEKYRVIDSDTRTVVVDQELASRVAFGGADWRELQRRSVQIAAYRLNDYHVKRLMDEIYQWTLPYDDFLGYMAGIIYLRKIKNAFLTDAGI